MRVDFAGWPRNILPFLSGFARWLGFLRNLGGGLTAVLFPRVLREGIHFFAASFGFNRSVSRCNLIGQLCLLPNVRRPRFDREGSF